MQLPLHLKISCSTTEVFCDSNLELAEGYCLKKKKKSSLDLNFQLRLISRNTVWTNTHFIQEI